MNRGTLPAGTESEKDASRWVRDMFGRIAPRYDLANHLLSFNVDKYWRARTVQRVKATLSRPDARVLDLCCGTGDLLAALEAQARRPLLGSDFCHPMLTAAAAKLSIRHLTSTLFEADALRLPLGDQSLDLLTVAFGFRNLTDYDGGLAEFRRVLRPGGVLAILEFTHPPNRAFASLYNFYSLRILPWFGGAISGAREAYTYLPESVARFPTADELAARISSAGFSSVVFEYLTFGIVALHLGTV